MGRATRVAAAVALYLGGLILALSYFAGCTGIISTPVEVLIWALTIALIGGLQLLARH